MRKYDNGCVGFCCLLGLALGLAGTASAQAPSGRQTTPDGRQVLVNRQEGGLQWAISYSPNAGTITGNVFDPGGGAPTYIWCERVSDDGVLDPSAVQIQWHCEGADACEQSPCLASNWSDLGQVPLGGFFFLPAADPFVTLQPQGTYCDPAGVDVTDEFVSLSLEIDTDACRYVSATQPSLTPIEEGEDLFVRVWNFELDEPQGGSGAFVLMVGDEVVYSEVLPIPKDSGLLGPFGVDPGGVGICVRPNRAFPAGTQVAFNIQFREPAAQAASVAPGASNQPSDLGRPLHTESGVIHMIEISVGSDCAGEPAGRHLTTNDRWTVVSRGLPPLPPL